MAEADEHHPYAHVGSWGCVRWFQRPNGERVAEAYFGQLSDTEKRQFLVLFVRIADVGKIHDERKFRHLQGKIYEFKTKDHRITCRQEGRHWFLFHGFAKSGQKTPRRELSMAAAIDAEFQEWLDQGGSKECPWPMNF